MRRCHKCSTEITLEGHVGRKEECPSCAASLHCCLACRFHEPSAHNQCREVGTEFIRDREAANFCDSFTMRDSGASDSPAAAEGTAKAALADLFKI
jgi:hypothetical protein